MIKTVLFIYIFTLSCFASGQIHPIVKEIFYSLPLEKSRKDLRDLILNDKRFILKDTSSVGSKNSTPYFSGYATTNGVIKSTEDSNEVLIVSGTTMMTTEKGGAQEFKNVKIVILKYYFSSKDVVNLEYANVTGMLQPILNDTTPTKSESSYSKGAFHGQLITTGKLFEHFEPYYSVEVSSVEIIPDDFSKGVFGLYIEFRQEDK